MFAPIMRRLFLFALLLAGLTVLPVMAAAPEASSSLRLGIKGYDPVAYFTLQRATPGQAQFEYSWDEHVWRFANAEHRELFKANPVYYAPQFANFCAVALARGEVREANPEYWLISDGKLYLFGKSYGPDLFRKDLGQNVERARHNRELLRAQEPGR
jgi:YHS domain-containing protein